MAPQVVKLNVGGTLFATTRQTLSRVPGTFLAELVSDSAIESNLYLDGALFVDRDPQPFRYILGWLREDAPSLPCNQHDTQQLLLEARFYGLAELARVLEVKNGSKPGPEAAESSYQLRFTPGVWPCSSSCT